MEQIQFKDRKTGSVITESVPGGGFLRFLYGGNPLGKLSLWILIKRKIFSNLFGKYMDSGKSQKKIAPFIEKYQIDMSEYQDSEKDYTTFNEFFYRRIKSEARPIELGVISPADGRVLAFQEISKTREFFVKGMPFNLASFLGDELLASKYHEGAMVIVRLAPVDYHRYHFPVSGVVGENKKISGCYYSVSPFALRKSLRIFCENKREYSVVNSPDYGNVLICDVGATLTGGIIQTHTPNTNVQKGDEKGHFLFGGSTLVLLFEKDSVVLSSDLVKNTQERFETYLKMGETIGEKA